jgi:hypothetical protein
LSSNIFDSLILVGRPASGKSEIIDYLNSLDGQQRRLRFHLGEVFVVDDFPMLWTWFEEDKLLLEMGKSSLHTNEEGYFKEDYLWDLLVRRLCLEYEKHRAERPEGSTVIIEFSRGSTHGGYRRAFQQLSTRILETAVVLYVNVSFRESMRKNRRRFNPQAPHSILEHSLPEEKMRRLYENDDWFEFSGDSKFLVVRGVQVPYIVFENEEDFTTAGGSELERHLALCCEELWRLYSGGKKKGPEE